MSRIFNLLLTAILIASCTDSAQTEMVSDGKDYAAYLTSTEDGVNPIYEQISLWKKKISQEPKGFIFYEKLGSSYHQLFEKTGQIAYLHKADSAYAIAQKLTKGKWKVPSLLSLSSLAIKRHDFQTAATYAVSARELTEEKYGPLLMQFDAEMELGNYQMAGAILTENKRMDSFDYLVRLSKYKDHQGDLDSAIYYMEKARELIPDRNKERKLWATSNLADMYGHAGLIEDSYRNYLKVLSIDPTYDYAMRGIAWIAYSNDRKPAEAKKIVSWLQSKTQMPDGYLLLAEMSEFEGNREEAENFIDRFVAEATKPAYEGMYNKYLIDIFIERGKSEQAKRLALEEIAKRPTPATYDWLAWTLFNQGKEKEAIDIYKKNVEGKTFEPDVIYHMGIVYYKQGKEGGENYLKESLEAAYELGPVVERKIQEILKV